MAGTGGAHDDRSTPRLINLPPSLVAAIEEAVSKGHAASIDSFVHQALSAHLDRLRRDEKRQARRAALLATPVLTVAEVAGRRIQSVEATEQWMMPLRVNGRLIAIPDQPDLIIPAFQLTDGGALIGVVAETNRILTITRMFTVWTKWAWWYSRTSYLSGASPIDLIHTDPRRILTAVRRSTNPHALS